MKNFFLLCISLAVIECVGAQPFPFSVPEEVRQIRAVQKELADKASITLRQIDREGYSSTGINGVPPELRDVVIASTSDLISRIEILYPYYGFTGTESLQYEESSPAFGVFRYTFREYINRIETSEFVSFLVDANTRRIIEIQGGPQIDRGFDTVPSLSVEEAITNVVRFTQEGHPGVSSDFYNLNGRHMTEVVYQSWGSSRAFAPYWRVQLEPSDRYRSVLLPHFTVAPDGEVRSNVVSRQ